MQTLAQFKAQEGVATIDFMQGKGRHFATVNDKSIIIAEKCDLKKPLYIGLNEEKGVWVIYNSVVKQSVSL